MSERDPLAIEAAFAEIVRLLTDAYHPDRIYLLGSAARGRRRARASHRQTRLRGPLGPTGGGRHRRLDTQRFRPTLPRARVIASHRTTRRQAAPCRMIRSSSPKRAHGS
jgi:hypothetical protein